MLGTELCKAFEADHRIAGMDVVRPQFTVCKLQAFYEASITDIERVREVFDKEKPELVIHAAAWTDVDGCENDPEKAYEINTAGTCNIAEASGREIPIIFISTDFIFDGGKGTPYTESDIGRPLSVYGKTKWDAEEILKQDVPRYLIVRTSWLYGENGRNFVTAVLAKGKTEKHLKIVNIKLVVLRQYIL